MKMRVVKAVRISDRCDLLAPPNALSALNQDFIEMPVKRIHVARSQSIAISMAHDDNVPPALMAVACENDDAIADTINRIAKIGVATADSVPIFTEMSVRTKTARLVIAASVRFADGHVESVR